ncbi:MAG: flagellar biosynthesis protein FlhA [Campylobacterota bacterium]|nr:flagellar biosynthesis protein FlhA [Campylobacterota bacterium]
MNIKNILFRKEYLLIGFVFSMLAIIIVPLPKGVLDFFLILSLTSGILILLISLFIQKPTDLSTFPTLLLILVMFRLSLNIATTRSILSEGHNGPEAVSSIISAFGEFVVGGNMVIGVIVFIILVLINFMVVTQGAGRVAEVQARFSLDSLPGKQMAIDADLNAGFIDDKQAKQRREELASEVSFYGTMDGSAKFVKGDAVAGIIITLVNLIGGLTIGILEHGLTAAESSEIYTILTIGDGLVAQIPALVISTATAIIITRSNADKEEFAGGTIGQLAKDTRSLVITGMALLLFSMVPGFPTGILLVMGIILMGTGYLMHMIATDADNGFTRFIKGDQTAKKAKEIADKKAKEIAKKKENIGLNEEQSIDKTMKLEVLELKLGASLLRLVQGDSELLDKIKGIRNKIAADLGFVIPQIRISDDSSLYMNQYSFNLKRVPISTGNVELNKLLAMGGVAGARIQGKRVKEPVFNLDATWIDKENKDEALNKGFTVVDAPTIISTHISELIKKHAEDIITRQDLVDMIDRLKGDFPIIVEEAMKVTNYGVLLKVCKDLLHENIPLIDMVTILEAVSDIAEHTKSPDIILEHVRSKLFRLITDKFKSPDGSLHILTIKSEIEQDFISKLQEQHGVSHLMISIGEINNLVTKTRELITQVEAKGVSGVSMIVDPSLRRRIAEIFEKFGLSIAVLSHAELDSKSEFVIEGTLEF